MVNVAITASSAAPVGVMGSRVVEAQALAESARAGAPAVVIDQAEDLRRRLLEQEILVRAEADVEGLAPSRVEAALTSTRAAAHVLETISTAAAGELEQQQWVASHVVRFAARLIDSAQEQLQPPPVGHVSVPLSRPALSVARSATSPSS